MNQHPFDIIELENGAKLLLTPCPGTKGASLESSLLALKQAGTNMVITLMFDKDMQDNNICGLPQLCKGNGIGWIQLPIVDDSIPCDIFESKWDKNLALIRDVLVQQGVITIHCKGGYGRTGLVAGLILISSGLTKEQAKNKVQEVRPNSLRNERQLAYFNAFSSSNL